MEEKDIIGKEFTCFEFTSKNGLVNFDSEYSSAIGKTATVLNINNTHPEYTFVKINLGNYRTKCLHYPTQMIIDQLERRANVSIEEILNNMKKLILEI
jgi:hypothetical protein